MSLRLVVLDDDSLERAQSGTVWGRVYFETGDEFFPERGWTDMAIAFLNAWLAALLRIASGSVQQERVCFMDGPFELVLSATNSGLVDVGLIHKEDIVRTTKAAIKELLQDAVLNGKNLLRTCDQRGWQDQDRDIRTLAEMTLRGADVMGTLES
jgi:hypothetical protein